MPSSWRSRLPWLITAVSLCVIAGDSAVLAQRLAGPDVPRSVAVEQRLVSESPAAAQRRATARDAAVKALFERRAEGVRRRDRAAFLATIDPEADAFREKQEGVFASLGKLEFSHWSYEPRVDESYSPASIEWEHYRDADDLWLPALVLRYQIKGFDKRPVARRVVYTVVQRGGRWYVANDADLEATTSTGTSVRIDPWESGPIVVRRSAHGIVIGHQKDAAAVAGIVAEVESAVRHVSSYVGKAWGERVVIVLPADHDELQHVLENPDVPFEFAAIARPEYTELRTDGQRLFAGGRVVINPDNFEPGDATNRMLIRHEMTHVALFERTGPLSPKWLVEGVAEYVGNAGSSFPVAQIGGDLGEVVDEKGPPAHLPGDSDFGLIADAGPAYNEAWLACRYVASHWGRAALFRLYDAMGNREGLDRPGEKLGNVLRAVLRVDEETLVRGWQPYVRASVGDLSKSFAVPAKPYKEDDTGEVDVADLAKQKGLDAKRLTAMGLDRAVEGFWYVGDLKQPQRLVVEAFVVGRDEAAAGELERLLGGRYARFDSSPRSIPHGRLYFVGVSIGGRHYNQTVAILRDGILVMEVRVAVPGTGDPRAEARSLAARLYGLATA